MSTNARIALKLSDKTFVSVYHHWDGYPEWLGVVLTEQYNKLESVIELLSGGDMSSCWSDNEYDSEKQEWVKVDPRPTYYSERGETAPPRIAHSITEFLDHCDQCGGEFGYVYDKGEWFAYETTDRTLVDIPEEIAE